MRRAAGLIGWLAGLVLLGAGVHADEGGSDDIGRFTHEVMGALERRDAVAMTLLVDFPLRVNLADGSTILIEDEFTLRQRFDEVFPPAFRQYVLQTEKAGTGENGWISGRYMFDHGALWARNHAGRGEADSLRVETVVSYLTEPPQRTPSRTPLFACETARHRIVIDSGGEHGALRYRAWNKPHFPPDPPDLILTGGKDDVSGTGPCSHSTWTFRQGDTRIVVEEGGCSPEPGRATLAVEVGGEEKSSRACY